MSIKNRLVRESDDSGKKIAIIWGGLKVGPIYGSASGQAYDKKLEALSAKVRDSKEWKDALKQEDFKKACKDVIEVMKNFAKENGYTVVKSDYDSYVSESLSEAEEKKFVAALKAGEVNFSYKKVDGSTREAVGTLKPELMDGANATDKKIEAGKKKHFVPPTVLVYWDLEAKGFRSFRKENFIKYEAAEEDKDKKED